MTHPLPAGARIAVVALADIAAAVAAGADTVPVTAWATAGAPIPAPDPVRARVFTVPQPGPARARVYRTPGDPGDPATGPCWHWSCDHCRTQGNGCAHTVLHHPGTWPAALCAGLHHVHTEHPRPGTPQGEHPHTTLGSRRRCDTTAPTDAQLRYAVLVLFARTGYPRGERARTVAREVLALAGIRTPGR